MSKEHKWLFHTHRKKDIQMTEKYFLNVLSLMSHQGNSKQNQHLLFSLEWLNLKRLTITNIDEDVEQLQFSCSNSKNQYWYNYRA